MAALYRGITYQRATGPAASSASNMRGVRVHLHLLSLQERPVAVLHRHCRRTQWPLNTKFRIVKTGTPDRARSIKLRGQIMHLSPILKRLIAMGAALGHVQHPAIFHG